MHDTAYETGRLFFDIYVMKADTIVEIGSWNINGTLRDFCPPGATYIGLDQAVGPDVDVVISSDTALPLASEVADVVMSSSSLEHDKCFWETFLEIVRVTKPGGLIYLSAPANGPYHRHPEDNWRFYPDCGKAIEHWARKCGNDVVLRELFIAERMNDYWNDFVAVFQKGPLSADNGRRISTEFPCTNVRRLGETHIENLRESPEDMVIIQALRREIETLRQTAAQATTEIEQLRRETAAQSAEIDRLRRESGDGLSEPQGVGEIREA